VYENIRTSNPLPTVASRSANSCSHSEVPKIASRRTQTRVWRSGMSEVAQGQTPPHILTIKCQVSFFYGRSNHLEVHRWTETWAKWAWCFPWAFGSRKYPTQVRILRVVQG